MRRDTLPPLPIDPYLDDIVSLVRRHRALVVTAEPGAGKTTRVPPALVDDGVVLLLQPRRVAARAIARRIADEQGWSIGDEVGWQVRFDACVTAKTRLIVATEGILTARLQQDPLASDLRTIVVDEFHERSIHADLGLALARQASIARDDLRIVVMSATLDADRVAAFLDGCPVVRVPGRLHPVEIEYQPGEPPEAVIARERPSPGSTLLCFLPGAREIRQVGASVASAVGPAVRVLPLYGALDGDEQDRALERSAEARVILATNVAETTLTVPNVRVVVDGGLQKIARYDADRAIDSLETERVTQDAADQRAGRAGRTSAGRAIRLWDRRDRLRPYREPEIRRVDLTATVLDVISWGGDPGTFQWFEAPSPDAIETALDLLARLGAIDDRRRLTAIGHSMRRLSLHPRLARLVLDARGAPEALRACAWLSERHVMTPRHQATTCDLLAAVEEIRDASGSIARAARDIGVRVARVLDHVARSIGDAEFRRAVLSAYPDRVARRRAPGAETFLLASGAGARLGRESGVYDAEFVVAVDVTGAPAGVRHEKADALIRIATGIDRDWIRPTSSDVEHRLDPGNGVVRAARVERYGAIELSRSPVAVDPEIAGALVAAARRKHGPTAADEQWLRRLAFAGVPATFDALVDVASVGQVRVDDVDLAAHVPYDVKRTLDARAPASISLPGGRHARLDYRDDGRVVAAVRIQQIIGLTTSPTLGAARTPVTFEILAPSGRPVQITSDLENFWRTAYLEIRPALRARYPKHRWP